MKNGIKLIIDIVMGAVIPIIILESIFRAGSAWRSHCICARGVRAIGVGVIDLFFVTKKFNFITSYVGFSSIVSGILAFWFVDGLLYAIKDTVGLLLRVLVFGGSVLIARPILKYFFIQALNPDTPDKAKALAQLFNEPSVARSFSQATWLVVIETALAAVFNFYLNLRCVLATFGTELFNQQVASCECDHARRSDHSEHGCFFDCNVDDVSRGVSAPAERRREIAA